LYFSSHLLIQLRMFEEVSPFLLSLTRGGLKVFQILEVLFSARCHRFGFPPFGAHCIFYAFGFQHFSLAPISGLPSHSRLGDSPLIPGCSGSNVVLTCGPCSIILPSGPPLSVVMRAPVQLYVPQAYVLSAFLRESEGRAGQNHPVQFLADLTLVFVKTPCRRLLAAARR